MPWRCHGCIIDALVHEPDRDLVAERRDDRRGRREAPAVDREAAQRVVADPDDVLGDAVVLVVALRRVLRLDDERAQQPAAHLVRRVVVRVVHVRAGRLRGELVGERVAGLDRVLGDRAGRRPCCSAARWPWKWMPVDSCQVVLEDRPDLVALDDVEPRAGPRPVEPERRRPGPSRASIWCWISSTVNSKTLTSPSSVGC